MPRDREADLTALQAVHSAAQSGDFATARALAQPALETGLEHPLLFNVIALGLERDGDLLGAVSLLSRAVKIDPRDIGVRNALGLCLLRLDRPAEALTHFAALLAIDPSQAFGHTNWGAALLALGSITEAEASYRRALALDPTQSVAMAGLAHIASRRGRYAEARSWAEQALVGAPNFPDAVMSLAMADLGESVTDQAELRLRALMSGAGLDPVDRAYATGLLGDVLDAQGRVADAFAAYTDCNEALRSIHAARFASGQSALDYVRAMTRYFEREKASDWNTRATDPAQSPGIRSHVFLLGFPRSGTTLLEVALEGHPGVASLEENESLIAAVREFMGDAGGFDRLSRAGAHELQPFRQAYWKLVADAGLDVAGKIFVDKHPLNTLKLPLIARLFPDAKIVFACRDPRDVVLSCYRRRFRMSAPMYELLSLERGAQYYDAVMRLAERLAVVLPQDVCMVAHERLVEDFEPAMQQVCAFLGLEWLPAMGDFAARTQQRAALTPSTAQLARGLNTSGIGQWRRYATHLAPVLPILEPWVKHFGYTL
jgi:tetratricopeptide (TPR) repeat protein